MRRKTQSAALFAVQLRNHTHGFDPTQNTAQLSFHLGFAACLELCTLLAGVTSMMPGDAVMGIAPGCLGPAVHVPAGLVVRKPPALSFQDACTAPTVFCTVHAAFDDCIGLGPGSKARSTR